LNREFRPDAPNKSWAGDVTFLRTPFGFVYLAVVIDLSSRFVVGWAVSAMNDRNLVFAALKAFIQRRSPARGLVHHRDQGRRYTSEDYQRALGDSGIVCSMSRRGNCYDNAAVESFFGTFKTELGENTGSAADAKSQAFDDIEVFYNQQRMHSALGNLSPAEYERAARMSRAAWVSVHQSGSASSSPVRLVILDLLAQAPRTVEVLAGEIEQTVANTSHHLQALKRAQLVTATRDGLHVSYAIAGPDVAALVAQLQDVAAQHIAGLEKLTRAFFADPAGLEPIDRDTLLERLRARDVTLLDVRPEQEFIAGHLPGALSMPLPLLEARLGALPRGRTIVAYCRGPFCTLSAEAVRRLRALGFDARRTDVSVHSFAAEGIPA
jgi:rhodanese-related sulfurtransferase